MGSSLRPRAFKHTQRPRQRLLANQQLASARCLTCVRQVRLDDDAGGGSHAQIFPGFPGSPVAQPLAQPQAPMVAPRFPIRWPSYRSASSLIQAAHPRIADRGRFDQAVWMLSPTLFPQSRVSPIPQSGFIDVPQDPSASSRIADDRARVCLPRQPRRPRSGALNVSGAVATTSPWSRSGAHAQCVGQPGEAVAKTIARQPAPAAVTSNHPSPANSVPRPMEGPPGPQALPPDRWARTAVQSPSARQRGSIARPGWAETEAVEMSHRKRASETHFQTPFRYPGSFSAIRPAPSRMRTMVSATADASCLLLFNCGVASRMVTSCFLPATHMLCNSSRISAFAGAVSPRLALGSSARIRRGVCTSAARAPSPRAAILSGRNAGASCGAQVLPTQHRQDPLKCGPVTNRSPPSLASKQGNHLNILNHA